VVGRAAAVLTRRRTTALVALLALLVVYYEWHRVLPRLSLWWAIAVLSVIVIPATWALVWLVLPLRTHRLLLPVGLAAVVVAALCEWGGFHVASNFAKLTATTALGFWFLQFFESVSWVVLVAVLIPFVDAFSVYRGPTGTITKHHFGVYEHMAFAVVAPGRTSPAMLGPPDLMFFALFLAASARWNLRVAATWICCVASYGLTLVWANASERGGVPALPLLSLGFLVANGDLLWRRLRRRPEAAG
jgi:hypothetical protein